jgi:hypothetical protein
VEDAPPPALDAALEADPWLARVARGDLGSLAPRLLALRAHPALTDVPGETLAGLAGALPEATEIDDALVRRLWGAQAGASPDFSLGLARVLARAEEEPCAG